MAVFISITTNAFEEIFADAQVRQSLNIRRPVRGMEIKENTYAVIKVITLSGEEIPVLDSGSPDIENGIGRSKYYANFLLENVQEQRIEKQQIVETFGEDFIFFFGERPRVMTFSGRLLNSNDFNWKSEFWTNYDQYFRGTKLLEMNARLYLYYDDVVVEGYLIQANAQQNSMTPLEVPFQFQLFVTNYAFIGNVGSAISPARTNELSSSPTMGPTGAQDRFGSATPDQKVKNLNQNTGDSLHGFLAQAGQFLNDASVSIQRTLETIKNTFYGRSIVVPQGIGNQLVVEPITNQANFQPAKRREPIHTNIDEYVEGTPASPQYDEAERSRVKKELQLRSPKQLEERARSELQRAGIDVSRPNTNLLLLGRAAFAGVQTFGSFGIRQADGELSAGVGVVQGLV